MALARWRAATDGHQPRWSLHLQVKTNGHEIIEFSGIRVLRRHAFVDGQHQHLDPEDDNDPASDTHHFSVESSAHQAREGTGDPHAWSRTRL